MEQLDIDLQLTDFQNTLWMCNLPDLCQLVPGTWINYFLVNFGPVTDGEMDRQKAMHMSPPCIKVKVKALAYSLVLAMAASHTTHKPHITSRWENSVKRSTRNFQCCTFWESTDPLSAQLGVHTLQCPRVLLCSQTRAGFAMECTTNQATMCPAHFDYYIIVHANPPLEVHVFRELRELGRKLKSGPEWT